MIIYILLVNSINVWSYDQFLTMLFIYVTLSSVYVSQINVKCVSRWGAKGSF
jgi:hypothetical protein